MNNEPVAWMMTNTDDEGEFITFHKEEPSYGNPVALYADLTDEKGRPMTYWGGKANTAKELTDDEILEVWRENERVYPLDRSRLLDRTRACIRKAQEK